MEVLEPTEWISSLEVATTPNKFRLCLDPKDINKVVICPKYQMPTLEELQPKVFIFCPSFKTSTQGQSLLKQQQSESQKVESQVYGTLDHQVFRRCQG